MISPLLWVALGGALGSAARYAMNLALRAVSPAFPWGTFAVNVLGCFIFGLVAGLEASRGTFGPSGRLFLLVGVLGGFTTFSSFAFESVELIYAGQPATAAANMLGQLLLGTFAVWAGLVLTR
ncbi:MAG: fluoride efflux transporter CrcB [Vicinamibacterales bacterium]